MSDIKDREVKDWNEGGATFLVGGLTAAFGGVGLIILFGSILRLLIRVNVLQELGTDISLYAKAGVSAVLMLFFIAVIFWVSIWARIAALEALAKDREMRGEL